jgi:competence protein ComEC
MNSIRPLVILAVLTVITSTAQARGTLDIYFIDVEGGAATLIVTPLNESILIDSGFPTERDASRIFRVARIAGLKRIDHYITTHWHRDHVGGIPLLIKLIPVAKFYDHGIPSKPAADVSSGYLELYRQISQNSSVTLQAGDEITLRNNSTIPALKMTTLTSNATVPGEERGAPQVKPCGTEFKPIPEDRSDNANSLGFLFTFGDFKFYNGGDLTWNVENKLVCPTNLVGPVDLFQVNHHGVGNSNNPTLLSAITPRVAVIDNGPRKGADAPVFARLKSVSGLDAIYQLHRNVRTTDSDNAPADYIANDEQDCQGAFIKVSVAASSKKYQVSIPAKRISRQYDVK